MKVIYKQVKCDDDLCLGRHTQRNLHWRKVSPCNQNTQNKTLEWCSISSCWGPGQDMALEVEKVTHEISGASKAAKQFYRNSKCTEKQSHDPVSEISCAIPVEHNRDFRWAVTTERGSVSLPWQKLQSAEQFQSLSWIPAGITTLDTWLGKWWIPPGSLPGIVTSP